MKMIKGWHLNFTPKEHKSLILVKEKLMEKFHMKKCTHHDFVLICAELVDANLALMEVRNGN